MVCDIPPRAGSTLMKAYIGFSFGGWAKYRNLTAEPLHLDAFMIYPEPEIFRQDITILPSAKSLELKVRGIYV